MKQTPTAVQSISTPAGMNRRERGFSLLELMVATAIFLIVASAAFSLFDQNVKLATHQQNLSTVNIGLRNAMTQMEEDLSGAGQNLLASVPNAGTFSLGVIINNNVPGVAAACTPTSSWAYPVPSACFDSLTIINPKGCAVLDINDGAGQENLGSTTTMVADDPNHPGVVATLTADATCFKNGDEVLVVQIPTPGGQQQSVNCDNGSFNYCVAAVNLTADASVVGSTIQLQHNTAGADADPLGVIFNGSATNNFSLANSLNSNFSNGAYIIDLGNGSTAVTYAVQNSASDATDPQLLRCAGTACTTADQQLLSDQVIGFKVGAALWDNAQANATDIANYFYNSKNYCSNAVGNADCTTTPPPQNDPNDFTLVRAVRVSVVGRTHPNGDLSFLHFNNGFDNGPYLVQQASVVIDLRNLSNPDTTN